MAFNLADMVAKRPKQIQEENSSDTVYRDVFKLIPSKANFYGVKPEKLQGLKNSILLFGVMQDVLIEERDGEDYIISGHCRTMCCRMLVEEGHEEFRKINCKYTKVKDNARKNLIEENCINGSATRENDDAISKLLERLSVIQANRFRDKSDWEKMREALDTEEIIKELKNLAGLKGKTRDIVRETIGVSGTQMERYHAVQKRLSAEWMAEFEAEKINITVARELADLDEKYQKQAMEHYMEHDIITQAEVRAFKKLQEDNRDIPGQFTLAQATGRQRPPENETPIQPELQIERLFEALNKGERERVVKCDTRMAAYLISIRYRDVRIRNGHFNYQTGKEGIIFNPDDTMQHTLTWNELAEELVKRYGKKQKPVKMVPIDAPEKPEKNNSSAHRPVEPEKSCFSAAEAPDNKQQEHIVEDNKTPENDSVEVNKIAECSSDTLPEMKNNDQRKAWLRAYKDWGLWYEDKNIGVKYYKYDFQNGARLIVEEYAPDPGEQKSWWVSRMTETYYMHLVGGPEPDRVGGVPKWTYHARYDKFPNSETELCEFLKGLQK
ncbi:MAG: ParB-like nuclease domain [Bacteriophage sp.]|nr:MAG: ParB-like nuclease domain [Bacteriophage sp.]